MKNTFLAILTLICFSGYGQSLWINEIHYDNTSTDVEEGIEIAGDAFLDLACYDLVFYNGTDGTTYNTVTLSGSLTDAGCGYGTLWFPITGIQNGAPDGIALVYDPSNPACSSGGTQSVIMFLSYEGSFLATNGPASGMNSTDIGVFETTGSDATFSLQLNGAGTSYADFTWSGSATSSHNSLNTTQTIDPCTPTVSLTTGTVSGDPFTVDCINGDNTGSLSFTATGTFNAGNSFIVEMSDAFGNFTNAVQVGTLSMSGLDPSGSIPITIQAGTNTGSGYRFRVISTDPSTTASNDNGSDISITNSDGSCVASADLCAQITQFQVDPEGGNNGTIYDTGEFIQICNVCSSEIDISCFVLCFTDDNSGSRRGDCIRIPDGTTLAAGECYLMGGNGTSGAGADWSTTLDLNWHTCGCVTDVDGSGTGEYVGVLTDGGEDITLFNGNGDVVSAITFGSTGGANYSDVVAVDAGSGCSAVNVTIPPSSSHLDVGNSPGSSADDEGWWYNCWTESWEFANHDSGDSYVDLDPDLPYDCILINPLPIELTEFSGQAHEIANVLFWTTASEYNNDFFILERSANGFDYDRIALVDGAGITEIQQDYQFLDSNPFSTSYYRLSQVDFDGKQEFFEPILIREFGTQLVLSPNPMENNSILRIYGADDSNLEVFDPKGELIAEFRIDIPNGEIEINLPPGLYIVRCGTSVERLMVR